MLLGLGIGARVRCGISLVPAALAALSLCFVGSAVTLSWIAFGRQTITLRHLILIPVYLGWKIPLYVGLLLKGKQKSWERTARGTEGPAEPVKSKDGDAS